MWYLHHKIPWIVKYFLFVILCFTVLDIFRSHKGDKTSELIASLGSAWRAPPLRPCATFLVIGEESLQWFCGSCNDVDLLIPTVYQCSLDGARDALPQFLGVVEGYLAPVKGFPWESGVPCDSGRSYDYNPFCILGKHMLKNDP